MTQPIRQKPIHFCRRSALQDIKIHGCIQKQWTANDWFIVYPWQIVIGPRGVKSGVVELKDRATGEKHELDRDAAIARVSEA